MIYVAYRFVNYIRRKNMNTLSVTGNLANLKTRETNSGTAMVTFGVADRQYQNGEERTQWWNCTAFGKKAETLAKFKDKLSKITVNGKVVQNNHDGKLMSDDFLIHTRNYVNEYEEKMEKKRKKQRRKKQGQEPKINEIFEEKGEKGYEG